MIVCNYLSIWEDSHRWHKIDPNKTDPADLPMFVQDTLRHLSLVSHGKKPLFVGWMKHRWSGLA